MGFSYNVNVLNQKGSPALYTDTFANRPNAGYAGRLFIANDTSAIYEDTGTAWVLIANVSSGAGTLEQVTTNGNTTTKGISISAGGLSTNSLTDTALTLGSVLFAGAAGLVTQDNAAFFWDDTNNRLGINTVTPTNTLDLHYGGTGSTIGINNTAGNQSAIIFVNTGVNKWRIGNSATNTFDFYNSALASIAAYLDNSNNAATFNGSVQVLSSGGSRDTTTNITASISDSSSSYSTVKTVAKFSNNGSQNITKIILSDIINQDCNITFKPSTTGANATFGIGINAFNNFVLKGDGKIGIGTDTPSAQLEIKDSSGFRFFTNTSTQAQMNMLADLGLGYDNAAQISAVKESTNNAYLAFLNKTSGSATEKMRIAASGNILINSTTDDTVNKLQVTGSAKISSNVVIGAATSTNLLNVGSSAGASIDITTNQNNGTSGSPLITSLNFKGYNNNINGQIRVDDISGSAQVGVMKFYTYNSGQSLALTLSQSGAATFTNLSGTGSRAVLADANGLLSAPVSDKSVKENIEPLKYGLNTIMQLNAVQFEFIEEYKNYGEGLQIGAIAQEVEQIIPEAVFKTPSTGLKGIDYNQFNGIYIKAIQEQQKIIESLIQRIELLENK